MSLSGDCRTLVDALVRVKDATNVKFPTVIDAERFITLQTLLIYPGYRLTPFTFGFVLRIFVTPMFCCGVDGITLIMNH